MPEWTPDQKKVIEARNPEILVSAAAGSGKTAVLVERVASLIEEGYKINRMLIITFTHAAASEMKEKIRIRLSKNRQDPRYASALESLESSDISTIHSFCQHLIKTQFQAIGKDPDTGICDAALQKQLFHKAFRNAVNTVTVEAEPEVKLFMKAYDPFVAEQMIKTLYEFLMSLPEPFEWMIRKCEDIPCETNPDHPWFRTIQRMSVEKWQRADLLLLSMENMFSSEDAVPEWVVLLEEDRKILQDLQNKIDNPEKRGEMKKPAYKKAPAVRNLTDYQKEWQKNYKDARDDFKKLINLILTLLYPNMDKTGKELATMAELLKGLRILTEATAAEYKKAKDDKYVEDFSDLEHDTLEILKNELYLNSIRNEYDHIFVDECQDVSAVQDTILQKIHGENNSLFMVGDVKQSIYRFRNADPTLFLGRMNSFSDDADAHSRRIFLQANFRSRPEVLETVNMIFRHTMKKDTAELDYEAKEELHPGRKTTGFQPVYIDLVENDKDETKLTDIEAIADHIVSRGTELLEERYEEKDRNYTWKDMVILMPKVAGDGVKLADALSARGVPVFFDGGRDFFTRDEILFVTDLLKLIDHPLQDTPLISVLRNTPFFFTDEDLGRVRLHKTGRNVPYYEAFDTCCSEDEGELGERCRKAKNRITEWRFLSENLPLSVFMWRLLRESGHYALSGAREDGALQQANLRYLCTQASECEKNGINTLHDFLGHIKEQSLGGDVQCARLLGEKDDLVRIMTMHKSKGLQFPVVFCVGIDKEAKPREDHSLKMHSELGVCLHYKRVDLRIERKTIADDIFAWQKKLDETAERIRLLYVAMTRAQEKLFMVSCKTTDPLWTYPECTARVLSASCGIDWIMGALNDEEKSTSSTSYTQGEKPWKIRRFDANTQKNVENKKVIHNLDNWLKSILYVDDETPLWKTRQTAQEAVRTLKTSVTSLIRQQAVPVMDEDPDEDMTDKRTPGEVAEVMRLSEIPDRPAFMQESKKMTAAHRGTVVHHMLSLIDLDALREDTMLFDTLRAEKKRMEEANIFTDEEAKQIRISDLARFYASEMGQRVLHSPKVMREWNFNLLIPEKDGMILQGIIDCAFREEDDWVILDYKTDRITDENQFTDEYRPQLEWYARAIETLTGKRVKERWLYALSVGKAYQV